MKKLIQPKLVFAALLSMLALTVSTTTFAHQSDGGRHSHGEAKGHVNKHKRDLYKKHGHHKQYGHTHYREYYRSPRIWERRADHRHYRPYYGYVPNSGISLHLYSDL